MKIESASIAFGLANIPILFTGVVNGSRETQFKTLHSTCNTPISLKKWCNTCGVELGPDDTVKGVKVNSKTFVPVEVEEVERDRTIVLTKFVPRDGFRFYAYSKHYYLLPDDTPVAARAYTALENALEKKKVAAVGSTSMWGKEHPVMVHAMHTGLMLTLLHVCEDIVAPPPVNDAPVPKALAVEAEGLIDRMSGDLLPEDWTSESRNRREAQVQATLDEIRVRNSEVADTGLDLMAVLRLSGRGKKKAKA